MVVHPSYPHLGATPDGCINCECCGFGVLEVKCPYSCTNQSFLEASKDSKFCLGQEADGTFFLKRSHAYFYQVQAQIELCNARYCDFVVWNEGEVVVLRIQPDSKFITDTIARVTTFFKYGVMPELLGKWYSKAPVCPTETAIPSATNDSSKHWCYCRGEESGQMIACDGDTCQVLWFHTDCLKIAKVPKGKWYCPDCRKLTMRKSTS